MVSLDKMISFIRYWDERDELFNEQAISYSSKLFNYAFLRTNSCYIQIVLERAKMIHNKSGVVQSRLFSTN
jgi:hypothetical protein